MSRLLDHATFDGLERETLRDRIDGLLDRVTELEQVIASSARRDVPVADLSPQQTLMVAAIAERGRIHQESLAVFLRERNYEIEIGTSMRTQLMRMRSKLRTYGIEIQTLPGWGYAMDTASRQRWARLAAPPPALAALGGAS